MEKLKKGMKNINNKDSYMYDLIDKSRKFLRDLDDVNDFTYSEFTKPELGSPIHETPSTNTPLVTTKGDDLSGFK